MPVRKPSIEDLRKAATLFHLTLTPEDLALVPGLIDGVIASYRRLDELAEPRPPVKYSADGRPSPGEDENKLNAWYWKCSIKGAPSGKLAGQDVRHQGQRVRGRHPDDERHSPSSRATSRDIDATVVTRILDAGGTIAGKATCESLCFSGGSHTSDPMPVHNPHKRGYSAGGLVERAARRSWRRARSTWPSAATRAARSASRRCVWHLRAQAHLWPRALHRRLPIELTLDHTGPMARTVADVARVPRGHRRPRRPRSAPARRAHRRVHGGHHRERERAQARHRQGRLRLGGRVRGGRRPDVQDAAHKLERVGAKVTTISIADAPGRHPHLERRSRVEGATMLDGSREQHGDQLEGPLHDEPPRRVRDGLAVPGERPLRDDEARRHARPVHAGTTTMAGTTPRPRTSLAASAPPTTTPSSRRTSSSCRPCR